MPGVGPPPAAPAPSAGPAPDAPDLEIEEQDAPEVETGKQQDTKASKGSSGKPQAHPWSKDLDEALNSDDPHEATNQILLKSQAYTTQVEQELNEYSKLFGGNVEVAQIGAGILMELEADPVQGMVKLAHALSANDEGGANFDPEDLLVALEDIFFPEDGEDGEIETGTDSPNREPDPDAEPDEDREIIEWAKQRREQEQLEEHQAVYREILDGISEEFKKDGETFDEERFHKLVTYHGGNLRDAMDDYLENWHVKGNGPGKPAPPVVPPGAPEPREAKTPGSIREAVDDLFLEEDVANRRK